jgi:hypothetical protein
MQIQKWTFAPLVEFSLQFAVLCNLTSQAYLLDNNDIKYGLDWWTELVDWIDGLDRWTKPVDWTGGLDSWARLVGWTRGLDWTGQTSDRRTCVF